MSLILFCLAIGLLFFGIHRHARAYKDRYYYADWREAAKWRALCIVSFAFGIIVATLPGVIAWLNASN